MADKLVDASALAAIVYSEPAAPLVLSRLGNAGLVSTTLLPYEMANICLTKCRRMPHLKEQFRRGLAEFFALSIDSHDVNMGAAFALAERTGLTAYDASYLWLSRHLGLELVTLDRQLDAAAQAS